MRHFLRNTVGATAIEYAVICAVVILVMLTGLMLLGGGTGGLFGNVAAKAEENM